ncbi:26S proteasome non-ATPase regulatory subunit 10-like [Ctenocephalides felis]|uniref:26S proteasome non-ATPase regulatory subunit 10-like n=1 Tax=Ctenocephalides felis TaxID=7515 RepID=UPI000E6E1360|nr:26S proteasome non-ATPase regulatory subunit 10-like [Ctenocephalides felis]
MDTKDDIYQMAYRGEFNALVNKLDESPNALKQKDDNERYLSHWAALGGHDSLLAHLLNDGCPMDSPDDMGSTPLILAASAGREDVVKILLTRGADINHQNNQGHSALQYASSKGWPEIVDMLLQNGADVNITDNQGATPLHRAASQGKTAIVRLLLANTSIKLDLTDISGNTPLHLACEEDRQEEAKLLVLKGANLELKNKEGQTPLDLSSPGLSRTLKQAT